MKTRSVQLALFLGLCAPVGAATVLDWSDWSPTFSGGSTGKQEFTNSAGLTTEYQPKTKKGGGNPKPEFVFGTPAISIDPSTADEGLRIEHAAKPGNGSTHRFSYSGDLQGASFTVSGIDSSLSGGNNHIDEMQFSARLADGSVVAPTRIIVTNSAVVQTVGLDTVRAVAGQTVLPGSADGTVEVFFDVADVDRIDVTFLNSTTGTNSGVASNQAISFGDLVETGLIVPPPIPEPGSVVLALFGGLLFASRRRR